MSRGALGELLEETGADSLALEVVGDRERRLGRMGVAEPDVVPDRHDALLVDVAHDADQRALLGPVGCRRGCARSGRRPERARGSGGSGCAPRDLRRTRRAPGRRSSTGGRRRSVVPSRRMTSTAISASCPRSVMSRSVRAGAAAHPGWIAEAGAGNPQPLDQRRGACRRRGRLTGGAERQRSYIRRLHPARNGSLGRGALASAS